MIDLIALLTKNRYWVIHSLFVRAILVMHGMIIGRNFLIKGTPKLKIKGQSENIIIGDNVSILGDIDIRNREDGRLIIGNNVTIEQDCRFVTARGGTISIGDDTVIGAFAVFNGGADIHIGEKCLFAVRTSINSNEHMMRRDTCIREQGFIHVPVTIGDDCWIGVNTSIHKGVTLEKGSIVGANAVVTKDTTPYSINAGIPARKISERM